MQKILFILLILSTSVFAETKTEFGEKITLSDPISLAQAIKKDTGKEQLIKAEVTKVCKMKGCWMMLEDKKKEYRVTFSDYGTKVPMSLIGKTILVQGKLKKKELTLEQTKHFVKDEGGDPSKVTKPRIDYRVVASGVKVVQ